MRRLAPTLCPPPAKRQRLNPSDDMLRPRPEVRRPQTPRRVLGKTAAESAAKRAARDSVPSAKGNAKWSAAGYDDVSAKPWPSTLSFARADGRADVPLPKDNSKIDVLTERAHYHVLDAPVHVHRGLRPVGTHVLSRHLLNGLSELGTRARDAGLNPRETHELAMSWLHDTDALNTPAADVLARHRAHLALFDLAPSRVVDLVVAPVSLDLRPERSALTKREGSAPVLPAEQRTQVLEEAIERAERKVRRKQRRARRKERRRARRHRREDTPAPM